MEKEKKKVFLIVVSIVIILLVISSIYLIWHTWHRGGWLVATYDQLPDIEFEQDMDQKTLTVMTIFLNDYETMYWKDVKIDESIGYAKLPSGEIKRGDVLSECEGEIKIIDKKTNTLLSNFNFS